MRVWVGWGGVGICCCGLGVGVGEEVWVRVQGYVKV